MIDPQLSEESSVGVPSSTLRQFAGLWLVFLGGFGCWFYFARDSQVLGGVLAGLAIVVGVPGLVKPAFIRPVFAGLMVLALPIGWLVSHLLLAVLYYVIFTPVGLLFKLFRRDILRLRHPPDCETYWTPKPAAKDVRSYFRPS